MSIQNLQAFNPFDDATTCGEGEANTVQRDVIHVRLQQRNGRKTLTTVQGLSEEYDLKRLVKAFKKEFACNGTVVEHAEWGEVIQLQGDQRQHVKEFLIRIKLCNSDNINLHGF